MPFSYQLPARATLSLFFLGECIEVICRIFLSYIFLIFLLFLPMSVSLLQMVSDQIQQPVVDSSTRQDYTRQSIRIVTTGKVISTRFGVDEVEHLLAVRHLILVGAILSIVATLVLIGLLLNRQHFSIFRRSRAFLFFSVFLCVFTLITIVLFPYFFHFMHSIFFPQGNFLFPVSSPLIQAFPLPFWLFAYIFVQIGAIGLLLIQAAVARRDEY